MDLEERFKCLQESILTIANGCGRDPKEVRLIAVSKHQPASAIQRLYRLGCTDFGESRVQEALEKLPLLPSDIQMHLIGTLQRKKVNKAIGKFALIHSVDTPELAEKIAEASAAQQTATSILLQVNVSGESSKHGLSPDCWCSYLERLCSHTGITIRGLMTMAPLTDDRKVIQSCFSTLRLLKEKWQQEYKLSASFCELSMGMSHDYQIAIEEGATMLRIGSAIFQTPFEMVE